GWTKMKTFELFLIEGPDELAACFPAFRELRPHLLKDSFLAQVQRQRTQSYEVLALRHEGEIKSVAGFRISEFLAWGKVLYIDDLSTMEKHRGHGYAGAILDWLIAHARTKSCQQVHLDSGFARHAAHRLYLQKGFVLSSHHMSMV